MHLQKYLKFYFLLLINACIIYLLWQNSYSITDIIPALYAFSIHNTSFCKEKLIHCPNTYKYCDPVFVKLNSEKSSDGSIQSHPNLAGFLLNSTKISCLIPDIPNIRWNGIYWQESWSQNPKFLLYSAHLDERKSAVHSEPNCTLSFIRILALYNDVIVPKMCLCQIWFSETGSPILTPIQRYDLIDYQRPVAGQLIPYMLSCPIPSTREQGKAPIAVSLVNRICEVSSNILNVTGLSQTRDIPPEEKTSPSKSDDLSIAVCGPALYYYEEDFSRRLIEWIEILYLIGVSKVILYETENHKNVNTVLDYYSKIGKVKRVHFRYPPPYLDEPSLRTLWTTTQRSKLFALENVYFTDCILRFKDEFRYLAHFDPDEIPILKKHNTLPELLQYLKASHPTSTPAFYHLKWKSFYSDTSLGSFASNISRNFYILRHNKHPKHILNRIDDNGKSIYDPNLVSAVYSHKPLLFVDGSRHSSKYKGLDVDPSIAYTAHFRFAKCGSLCDKAKMVEEDVLLKMKEKIIGKVDSVLKEVGLDLKD